MSRRDRTALADLVERDVPPGVAKAALVLATRAERRWGARARRGDVVAQDRCQEALGEARELLLAGVRGRAA